MSGVRHSLLQRQIRRIPGGLEAIPESLRGLLDAVDAAYREFDADRTMLERSLDLSSHELLEANAEQRALLVAFPDLVFRTNSGGEILECRGGMSADFYLEPVQLLGRRIQDLPGQEARVRFREALEHVRTTGQTATIEYALTFRGSTSHYEARLIPLDTGNVLIVIRNTSERRREQNDLERSFSLVRATLESTADGLLVMDASGRIVDFNRRFVEMWRVPDELILTRDHVRLLAFLHDQLADPAMLRCEQCDTASPAEVESVENFALKDGRFFERYTRPQRVGTTCVGRVCSFRDITESRRAAVAMRRAKEAAEEASRAKGNFLANVSHELRTPITGILGIAEFLLQTDRPEAERELLTMLQGSAAALTTVVSDMLDFSRIEAGVMELRHERFDLREIIQEIVDLMSSTARAKGLALISRVPRNFPERLVGDPVRIRQILMNLVGNAVKFTKAGAVSVEIEGVQGEAEWLDARILVRDTGIGIPEEHLAAIFESFTQVDGSSTRAHGGSGLGLSIATRLTEMMGGRIAVESRPGQGSTFSVEFRFRMAEFDAAPPTRLAA